MKKCKIFIAIDTNKISIAKKIIRETQTNKIKIGYKFGLEFILSKNGRNFISKLKNKIIFIDIKAKCKAAVPLEHVKQNFDLILFLTICSNFFT